VDTSSRHRSRVSNGTKMLAGVDGRRSTARRFRDLIDTFSAELGDDLSPAERLLVRLAATTFLRVETLQASVANGQPVDDAELIRNVNAGARIVRELREAKSKRKARGPTALETWLANRETEADADDADETESDE
jgi:hypothetical protein